MQTWAPWRVSGIFNNRSANQNPQRTLVKGLTITSSSSWRLLHVPSLDPNECPRANATTQNFRNWAGLLSNQNGYQAVRLTIWMYRPHSTSCSFELPAPRRRRTVATPAPLPAPPALTGPLHAKLYSETRAMGIPLGLKQGKSKCSRQGKRATKRGK